jgi:hypothetical protein
LLEREYPRIISKARDIDLRSLPFNIGSIWWIANR